MKTAILTFVGLVMACVLAACIFAAGADHQKRTQRPAILAAKAELINLKQRLDTCTVRLEEARRATREKVAKRVRSFDEIFQQGGKN